MSFSPLVVLPTRNRAELALTALGSVLECPEQELRVWVSDNSTDAAQAERLRAACAGLGDPRLQYLRPDEPLSMSRHWEWIVQRALAEGAKPGAATHLAMLTDRMVFVAGALTDLLRAAARHPQHVLVYPNDHLDDLRQPARLNQHEWTGAVVELDSTAFIAHMRASGWSIALPRLLNCMAPLAVCERLRAAYGNVLDSISPDVCFGFRVLEREPNFLFLDRPLIVDYAIARSNGHSAARGIQTGDFKDFLRQLDARGMNFLAPVPGLPGPVSSVFHEYNAVRAHSHSPRFPALNLATSLRLLRGELRRVEDPQERQLQQAAVAHWRRRRLAEGMPAGTWRDRAGRIGAKLAPGYLGRKLVKSLSRRRSDYRSAFWRLLGRCGMRPYAVGERISEWLDPAAALAHARTRPLPPVPALPGLAYRVPGRLVEVGSPASSGGAGEAAP
ncbi:MAG: hypothetical protein ISP90_04030 [Nevskia sp.]|nr:hypothetical protein [Nevskia sp.]